MRLEHVPKFTDVFDFSHAQRLGDGSDPFSRYKYCFAEFIKAMQNLLDEDGNSKI